MPDPTPPPYAAPTVHDETHRGIWYPSPSIASMGHVPHLLGYIEHHPSSTDGSFAICIAGGQGVFVKQVSILDLTTVVLRDQFYVGSTLWQALYESIPPDVRPPLNKADAGTEISLLMGGPMKAIGTTNFPFLLTDDSGKKVRIVLHAYVVPDLLMGMFMSQVPPTFDLSAAYGGGKVTFTAEFEQGTYIFPGLSMRYGLTK
ncbi:hypothetical protein H0H92_007622 [Tricholoma furcatifolium]|nr:hypothetical protein H0H92_007622 [Tricholoma furcatifolium]